MIVRSTLNCTNTPRLLFVLEEAGVEYESAIAPDGYFTKKYGIPGPALEDEDFVLVEIGALLRHAARRYGWATLWPDELRRMAEVDRWIDFQSRRLSRAVEQGKQDTVLDLLARLDRQLEGKQYILGELTVVDCAFAALIPRRSKLPQGVANVHAYLDRLAARPAYQRAVERTPT